MHLFNPLLSSFPSPSPLFLQVWHQKAKDKAAAYDKADWRVFDAANDILDLRLWAVSTSAYLWPATDLVDV